MKQHLTAIALLITVSSLPAEAKPAEKYVSESPSLSLGLSLIDAIAPKLADDSDNADLGKNVRILKTCLPEAIDNQLTEYCSNQKVSVTIKSVECTYSGHITGPISCNVILKNDNKVSGLKAHSILQAINAAGAGGEGAAGHRFVKVENVTLAYDFGQFDGGAGAKVTLTDPYGDGE